MQPQGLGNKLSFVYGTLAMAIATTTLTLSMATPTAVKAQASGGALTVTSDIQEANSETGVVTARGNVRINYPARNIQGTAAQAQYFSTERTLVLTGNVYVLQDGNSLRAERMVYRIDEGRFVATPAAREQVEAIYLVTESEVADPAAGNPPPPEPVITLPSASPNPTPPGTTDALTDESF